MRVAAVDCGTNSTRLLVAQAADDGPRPLRTLARRERVTRLGHGVNAVGRLSETAIDRTVQVLDDYARLWRDQHVERVRITATSAVRDAANASSFLDRVEEQTGTRPRILSGEDEAAASFLGSTSALAAEPPLLVLDIGGGSTELMTGADTIETSTSRQLGSVRLLEQHLHDDPPGPEQYAAVRATVVSEVSEAAAELGGGGRRTLIGVAGTITTLAMLHHGRPAGDVHGRWLDRTAVLQLIEDMAWVPATRRGTVWSIPEGREDVIVAGALILAGVLEHFDLSGLIVSEADLLDGVALGLLSPDARGATRRS